MSKEHKFYIEQGATFIRNMNYKIDNVPVDLSTYTAKMQIRKDYGSEILYIELSTENGRIELNNPEGRIKLEIDADATELLNFETGVYDIELYTGSQVIRLLQGTVFLDREVTK